MARKRSKNADILSKVRKRYNRAANRFKRLADQVEGAQKSFLESLFNRLNDQARKFTMRNLRNKYSADEIDNVVKNIEDNSEFALLSGDVESRQKKLGKVLIGDSDVASRFYAGTVEIWRGKKGDARDQAILDYFGVDTIYDAMNRLSDLTGEDILQIGGSETELYDRLKDAIREEVASRLALG